MAINTLNTQFEYYRNETNYASPAEVSSEAAEKLRARSRRIGQAALSGSYQI